MSCSPTIWGSGIDQRASLDPHDPEVGAVRRDRLLLRPALDPRLPQRGRRVEPGHAVAPLPRPCPRDGGPVCLFDAHPCRPRDQSADALGVEAVPNPDEHQGRRQHPPGWQRRIERARLSTLDVVGSEWSGRRIRARHRWARICGRVEPDLVGRTHRLDPRSRGERGVRNRRTRRRHRDGDCCSVDLRFDRRPGSCRAGVALVRSVAAFRRRSRSGRLATHG